MFSSDKFPTETLSTIRRTLLYYQSILIPLQSKQTQQSSWTWPWKTVTILKSIRHCCQWNYTATSVRYIHTQSTGSSVMLQKYRNTTGKQQGKPGSSLLWHYAASTGTQLPIFWGTVSDFFFRAKHSSSFKLFTNWHGKTTQNAWIFSNTTTKTSNLTEYICPTGKHMPMYRIFLLLLHHAWQLHSNPTSAGTSHDSNHTQGNNKRDPQQNPKTYISIKETQLPHGCNTD